MYLEKARFQNFKRLKDESLTFNKINLITGQPGQGKSAILYALVYAITGHLDDNISDYVRWNQDNFNIDLVFSHFSKKYNYKITGSSKGNSNKELTFEKEYLKNSGASNYLKSFINPTLTLFSNVSLQDQTTNLLFEKPAARLQKLKTVFGLDDIDIACNLIKEEIKDNKVKIEILSGEIESFELKTFAINEIPVLQDINHLYEELEKMDSEKELWETEYKLWTVYSEQKRLYEENLKKLNSDKQRFSIIENKLKGLGELKPVPDFDKTVLKDKKEFLTNLEKDLIKLENEIEKNENNKKQKDTIQNNINKKIEEKKEYPKQRIKPLDFSEDIFNENELKILSLKKKIEIIKNGKCTECGSDYSGTDAQPFKNELKELEKIQKENKEKKEKYDKIVAEQKTFKIKRDQINDMVENLTKQLNEIPEIKEFEENILDNKKDEIEKVKDEIKTLEKVKDEVEIIIDFNNEIEEKQKETKMEMSFLIERISSFEEVKPPEEVQPPRDFDNNEYKKIQDKINDHKLKEFENQKLEELNKKIKLEEKENKEIIKIKNEEMDEIKKRNNTLQETRKILEKDFSSFLISTGTSFIKKKMNNFFSSVSLDSMRYEISYENSDKGISFRYTPDRVNYSEINLASGFEKDLISVANRVALCSLQDVGILMLDEVDRYASTEEALNLFEVLFAENFNQYFIISHKDDIKEYIGNLPETNIFNLSNGKIKI